MSINHYVQIVKPSLGQPLILKPSELKKFEITIAGSGNGSQNIPSKADVESFLKSKIISLVVGNTEFPLKIVECINLFKLPTFQRKYTDGYDLNEGINNRELQYYAGFRWEGKIILSLNDSDLNKLKKTPSLATLKSNFCKPCHHAIYIHNDFNNCEILQITDLHISQRNDKITEILCRVRNKTECTDLKNRYINFNDNLRAFIKYVNHRVHAGEKIIVIVTGDIVDYAFDGWWDSEFMAGQGDDGEFGLPHFTDAPEYRWGKSSNYSNIKKFIEIILAIDGKGDELNCPIYTVLGNHDYMPNEYLLNCGARPYGIKEISPIEKYKRFGLTTAEANEYDFWAYPRKGGRHPKAITQKEIKDIGCENVNLNENLFYWLVKPKGWTLSEYISNVNYESNFTITIGKKDLLFFNSGHEIYPSVEEFIQANSFIGDIFNPPLYAKHYSEDGPHSKGITDEHLNLLNEVISKRNGEGTIYIFMHAPIINFNKSTTKDIECLFEKNASNKKRSKVEEWLKDTYDFKDIDLNHLRFLFKSDSIIKKVLGIPAKIDIKGKQKITASEFMEYLGFSLGKTTYFKTGLRIPYLTYHCVEGRVNDLLDIICGKYGEMQKLTYCVFGGDTHTSHEFHINKIMGYSGDPSDFYYFIDDYKNFEGETKIEDIVDSLHFQTCSPFFFTTKPLMLKDPVFREIGAKGFPQKDLFKEMDGLKMPKPKETGNFTPGYSNGYIIEKQHLPIPSSGANTQESLNIYETGTILRTNKFHLDWQSDGNLVLYGPGGAIWQTDTRGKGNKLSFHNDGNFVVYKDNKKIKSINSPGKVASKLILYSSGSLVLCKDDFTIVEELVGIQPYTVSLKKMFLPINGIGIQESLSINQFGDILKVEDFCLKWQKDGNLALYGPGGMLWHTATAGKGNKLSFHNDGNLVVYQDNFPLWSSNSKNQDVTELILISDGRLLLVKENGKYVSRIYEYLFAQHDLLP